MAPRRVSLVIVFLKRLSSRISLFPLYACLSGVERLGRDGGLFLARTVAQHVGGWGLWQQTTGDLLCLDLFISCPAGLSLYV